MKTISRVVSWVVSALVFIGVVKGLNASDIDGASLGQIMTAIINGVADLTIYLLPNLWEALSSAL
ncbi:hypothetical protein MHY13_03375 [Corynebacterium sp. ACRPE]|uniref:hypothetical protein n=1 Tax=Corynebacterium sp. ACRPE TaxID=2918196 RepID=UPI001EF3F7D0|nr:hypothetical protein [Corynebacterium sp. ACRPE]MCG7467174.1 hypothetical protein [Corynebacterium sp. ACRPE]